MSDPTKIIRVEGSTKCPDGMVFIPGSHFWMGADKREPQDDRPPHKIHVSPFCLDKHEVTNAEYDSFLISGKDYRLVETDCRLLRKSVVAMGGDPEALMREHRDKAGGSGNCGLAVEFNEELHLPEKKPTLISNKPRQPAVNVSWGGAKLFCESLGKRLPTEAEWEKAAVGSSRGFDSAVEYGTKSGRLSAQEAVYNTTAPSEVCSKEPNSYGLCDMTGNVWEWVNDWYHPAYYATSYETDPPGPTSGENRIVRGGAWSTKDPELISLTYRNSSFKADMQSADIGFRCAANPKTEGK